VRTSKKSDVARGRKSLKGPPRQKVGPRQRNLPNLLQLALRQGLGFKKPWPLWALFCCLVFCFRLSRSLQPLLRALRLCASSRDHGYGRSCSRGLPGPRCSASPGQGLAFAQAHLHCYPLLLREDRAVGARWDCSWRSGWKWGGALRGPGHRAGGRQGGPREEPPGGPLQWAEAGVRCVGHAMGRRGQGQARGHPRPALRRRRSLPGLVENLPSKPSFSCFRNHTTVTIKKLLLCRY
jgi:hypothetical protein